MKLMRWAIGGATAASAYVVYRYSIGKKAKGEDVFQTPEKALGLQESAESEAAPEKPAAKTRSRAKASKVDAD